jgi:hypothetical protein
METPARVKLISPALKPGAKSNRRDRPRVSPSPFKAMIRASRMYFLPSSIKALKKLGPACSPTEKMNRAKPKEPTAAGRFN